MDPHLVSQFTEGSGIKRGLRSVYTYASPEQYRYREMSIVTTVVRKWRDHRRSMRDMREVERAIYSAPSPTMRDELIHAAQRQNLFLNR
jgi:hypothetical protein